MKVHPVAEIFPMMDKDELNALAADIKTNGLQTPIVVDDSGRMIDGRNREAACKIAGVKPEYTTLNGHDPVAFILSANIARRHMTTGQQAMAVAMIYPAPEKAGRGKSSKSRINLVPSGRLSEARTVLKHLPEEAKKVLAGSQTLGQAFETAQAYIEASGTDEGRLEVLGKQAPDLAELVQATKMTLSEAYAAFEQRKHEREAVEGNKRETMFRTGEAGYQSGMAWASAEFVSEVRERLADKEFCTEFMKRMRFDRHDISTIAKGAKAFTAVLGQLARKGK